MRHPNVVAVIDAGMDREGSPFVVMERLRAKSVEALLVALQDDHGQSVPYLLWSLWMAAGGRAAACRARG